MAPVLPRRRCSVRSQRKSSDAKGRLRPVRLRPVRLLVSGPRRTRRRGPHRMPQRLRGALPGFPRMGPLLRRESRPRWLPRPEASPHPRVEAKAEAGPGILGQEIQPRGEDLAEKRVPGPVGPANPPTVRARHPREKVARRGGIGSRRRSSTSGAPNACSVSGTVGSTMLRSRRSV